MSRRLCVALLLGLVVVSCVVACAPSKAELKAKDASECFSTQKRIKMTMDLFYADAQMYPPLTTVVAELDARCPSGGVYGFDEKTDIVSCTVHGRP